MFDEVSLREYVGETSGGNYVTGLKCIEREYGISLEEEFHKDGCSSLLGLVEASKKEGGISETEKHARKDRCSHLKKYISMEKEITGNIKNLIQSYKKDFEKINMEERYKWEAVKWYKDHWDIDSLNFAEMVKTAFSKAFNLLTASNYYAYKMLYQVAEVEPEKVRSLFKILYDESLTLAERFDIFRAGFEEYCKPQNYNSYQDLHAISVYLSFEYPEKYFIYKYGVWTNFAKNIGIITEKITGKHETFKIECSNNLCKKILDFVRDDKELIDFSNNRLDESCYKDPHQHLLAFDLMYYGSTSSTKIDDWWPSLDEYNPNISKDAWKEYILKIEMLHPSPMQMLKAMVELGGEASCKKIAETYGGTPYRYVGCTMNIGRRVKSYFNLPACMDGDQERYFPFPFLGKKGVDGDYVYKLRTELFEALTELDLSDVSPYYTEKVDDDMISTDVAKNTILYGPPGTGKTYNTVCYAVAIIENKLLEDVISETLNVNGYDVVFSRYNVYKEQGLISFTTFHQSYGYEEFIEGIKPVINDAENSDVKYAVTNGVFKDFCEQAETINPQNRVFIIDEINRGNISKIFGELITLVEPSKRLGATEGLTAVLPYSKKSFGIPENVYILGTMNTADRSIATLDTALRRRFDFVEMMPDAEVLEGIEIDGISISAMLEKMNERIAVLFDREHTIGHAYFMGLKDNSNMETLANIFKNKVIPLLQEYFYENYERIRLVLADNQVLESEKQFIIAETVDANALFGNSEIDIIDETKRYVINHNAFENADAYIKIYSI